METNYELKHKCLLVPLKAVLLVFAMLLVGFTTFAQSGKGVRVANNEQLIEAMQNPSVGTIELQAGFYPYLNYQANDGAKVIKSNQDSGGRALDCTYYIINNQDCFEPITDPGAADFGFDNMQISAGYQEPFGGCNNCCPPNFPTPYPGAGWTIEFQPAGSTGYFADPDDYDNYFYANMAGFYILRYSWPAPYNSHVETQYYFYGPVSVDLEADDVCEADGLTTTVDFSWTSDFPDPNTSITWTLDGQPYAGPTVSGSFLLTVATCGPHVLEVIVAPRPGLCPPDTTAITIWFDCEPIADAGPDIDVCGDICTSLDGSVSVAIPHPQAYSWSWVNVSGPQGQTLTFSPNGGYMQTDVNACRGTTLDPCPYGVYEVQLQVQNGLCYDDDNALVTFYQQPVADAGNPQYLCNTFTFDLQANPFGYCGTAGVNYWSTAYWELVSQADPGVVVTITPDPVVLGKASVSITGTGDCKWGEYTFKWVEKNGPDVGGCYAEDLVTVTIFEDPAPNAGPDLVFCNTFAFSLWGIGDEPCYENTVVQYSWEKTCQPGNCTVTIYDGNTTNPDIVINNCDPDPDVCNYGKYCFEFTQCNGYFDDAGAFEDVCCSTDTKEVWILEPAAADAGPDQHICYSFDFALGAIPTDFCGDEDVNYFTWGVWEFVSGPSSAVTIDDVNDPESAVSIDVTGIDCPYGKYTFKWTEYNGFGDPFQGCSDVDYVDIYIDEVPESVNAGPDQALCNMFNFALDGTVDMPCTQTTAYSVLWEPVSQPDMTCTVTITNPTDIDPSVSITGCTGCAFGEYKFKLTQSNGYYTDAGAFREICYDSDTVSVWIFEPVEANAGIDQYFCDEFSFDLTATPTPFCGTAGVNYFTAGEWTLVSGPAPVVISDPTEYETGIEVLTAGVPCPWGVYTFKWTEKNGFFGPGSDPFGYCEGFDYVSVYIYEPLDVNAGNDAVYCDLFTFGLDASLAPLCVTAFETHVIWTVTQPDLCDVTFTPAGSLDPTVSITNCLGCPYGDYIFKVRVENGYYDELGTWTVVCWDEDEVTVTIYEHPDDVVASGPLPLCDDFTFDLTAAASDYCGANDPHYSWVIVSQPDATCTITFSDPTEVATGVEVTACTGVCAYGEYVFRFTEWNGPYSLDCSSSDLVTVTIFEAPDADAGDDVNECVLADNAPYCYDMTGSLEYCYSMSGLWTKSCGPGDVVFTDVTDPISEVCFTEPGRYKFTWTVWNDAEGCEDDDEVIFDLLEEPIASADFTEIYAECNTLCVDLGLAGVNKYVYIGTDQGECPNYLDFAKWTVESGPGIVTFDPAETAPDADICVTEYGGYTLVWNEVNKNVDGDFQCDDLVKVYVEFNETPEPLAVGDTICGNCTSLDGTLDAGFSSIFYWELVSGPCVPIFDPLAIDPEVCIEDYPECYGTYTFVLHQYNRECEGTATATILFKELPDPVAICYENYPNDCDPFGGNNIEFDYGGCLQPGQTFYTCADGWSYFSLYPWCNCLPGFDWNNPLYWGWTFEWSLISPAGTEYASQPGYFDFENGSWVYPWLEVNWGECCDTARIYLTITTDDDCELTLEYKAYVYHKPCVDIVGPEVAEVGLLELGVPYEYCNNCPPNPCLLYTWTAEPCGHIVYGQGTPCIGVEWDSYVINDGWGEITLTVFDTCTGCCNFDALPVKIYPSGTLGTAELSGYVLYHNNSETPLNGVEVQLWNGNVPVMSTLSFNDIEGGNGVGYYEFTNLSAVTVFGITASYNAPWYGANATDALAVELKSINTLPGGFIYDDVVEEAMNVNNSVTPLISSVDALWIKQRAINMVNYFPAGNWAFDQTMQTTATVGYDIYALNMGDANRSNIPNSNKAMSVDLVNDGMMNVVSGQVFDLPIRIAKADEFGAITLNLEYNPAMLEVVDVVAMEGMLSNITSSNVGIAWSNLNPMALADNDVVVTLKVKAIGEIASTESVLSIGYGSEFADAVANVVEPVTLKTFGITTEPAALDYFLSTNRPNPFSTSTFIEYTMPETGKVRLSVLDMLGQELAVLVDATQTAGSYTVEFSAAGLATGVYIYKISVDGESRDFISTQRMVVSH